MDDSKALVTQQGAALTTLDAVNGIKGRMNLVTTVYKDIMAKGIDFGVIPGCGDKPTLLKPGAEKLMMAFRIAASAEKVEITDLGNFHRDYRVTIMLTGPGGEMLGGGVGSCSTLEKKYRYRPGPKEKTDKPVPKEYWDLRKTDPAKAQALLGGPGHSAAKDDDGMWVICKGGGTAVENPDPADQWNTCLKMAKKRALIDACLTSLGASTMFTQDIEDMQDNGAVIPPPATPPAQAAPPPETPPLPAAGKLTAKQVFEGLKADAEKAGAKKGFDKLVDLFLCNEKTLDELTEADYENLVKTIQAHRKGGK